MTSPAIHHPPTLSRRITDAGQAPEQITALVIDDDAMMRLLVRETLEGVGMTVAEAADGMSGIAELDRARPDIILLDVMMPDVDGFATCRLLREHPQGKHTPIVMITGLDDDESIQRAYESGATDFVVKPINWPILAHRIRYVLRASTALEDLAKSESSLANAQRIAKLGSWKWNVRLGTWWLSPEGARILGVDRNSPAAGDPLFGRIHADDRDRVQRSVDAALKGGSALQVEYKVTLGDAGECALELQAEVNRDAGGRAITMTGTVQDVTERARAAEQIRHLAYHDSLTGLPNRLRLKEYLGDALTRAARQERIVAVLFLDLDNFKRINDTLGHNVGDELLKEVATRLTASVRLEDRVARDTDGPVRANIARMGGDEFILILTELQQPQDAAMVARRILDALSHRFSLRSREVFVSASIGIALFPENGRDQDALLMNADTAMYKAKEQGRNTYQFYARAMNATAFERLSLENDLRRALERDEFLLHYQPKIDTASGEIVGSEALLRWQHPELGLISPATFVPLAEESGLIVPIGNWVLDTACRQNRAWQDLGHPLLHVAVNMSGSNFRQKNLLNLVGLALRENGLAARHLELEVTESMLMRDLEETVELLKRLKALGVRLAIDDFGTGYSSLSYLKRFSIDTLKIDRSFVNDIITDPDDRAITSAIIAMARSLDLSVVAEGVETLAQSELLQALGCSVMQGYFYGRPMAAKEFEGLLRRGLATDTPKAVRDSMAIPTINNSPAHLRLIANA